MNNEHNSKKDVTNFLTTLPNGDKYAFDLEAIKKLCLISTENQLVDKEIQDLSNIGEDENDDFVVQKIVKENTYYNFQTDVIMADMVKQMMSYFIELYAENKTNDKETLRQLTVSQSIMFNTCLNSGIIRKIN